MVSKVRISQGLHVVVHLFCFHQEWATGMQKRLYTVPAAGQLRLTFSFCTNLLPLPQTIMLLEESLVVWNAVRSVDEDTARIGVR